MSRATARGKAVVVVGAGGNIGSHLVPHLARTPGVGRVTLVDGDHYDESNLWTQDIHRRDLGRPKAAVQAKRLREIDATLPVEAITACVEDVPLGRLRGDVLLACVDSRAARRSINAIAWRLGMPWIDAGVNGEALLGRINVYRPGNAQPCHECSFDAHDYATIEQTSSCAGRGITAASNAPSSLGALAAALQALECRKLLAGKWDEVAVGRQVTVDARGHRQLVTTLPVNPRCLFDHQRWRICPLAPGVEACRVEEAFEIGRRTLGSTAAIGLTVSGQLFATRLTCLGCGASRDLPPYLFGRLGPRAAVCTGCGGAMRVAGFDAIDWLQASDLSPEIRQSALASLGLRPGDVVSISDRQRIAHFELGGHS